MTRITKTRKRHFILCISFVTILFPVSTEAAPRLYRDASSTPAVVAPGAVVDEPPKGKWLSIGRDRLCVTEGAIERTPDKLSVNVSKMRAFVTESTAQSAELRITYYGATKQESQLGSGEVRRQIGLKLRAHDPCNLVYVMWRMLPESELVVSLKRNKDEHTSGECQNRGYKNIKPSSSSAVPKVEPARSHTLRAEMRDSELQVYVDDREVWRGDLGPDAASLEGPVGLRSDNAHFEFELLALESEGSHPDYVPACKTGAANSD